MVVTDLGVEPEVFTKNKKNPVLVTWVFCLHKILKIEPKGRRNQQLHVRNTSGIWRMQFMVLVFEILHAFRRDFKIFAGKSLVRFLLSLLAVGPP